MCPQIVGNSLIYTLDDHNTGLGSGEQRNSLKMQYACTRRKLKKEKPEDSANMALYGI